MFVRNAAYLFQGFDTVDSGDFGHNIPNSRKSYRPFDDHSDDSETSSVCSERSFDSYRRTSDVSTVFYLNVASFAVQLFSCSAAYSSTFGSSHLCQNVH
jgi:hypothetical protein